MRLLVPLLFASSLLSAGPCANRSVFVTLDPTHAAEARSLFLVVNSLPFEVIELPREKGMAVLQITYRRLTPGDRYSEPLALELGARVFAMLESRIRPWGIRNIRAEYRTDLGC
jgi:hypothetical protein